MAAVPWSVIDRQPQFLPQLRTQSAANDLYGVLLAILKQTLCATFVERFSRLSEAKREAAAQRAGQLEPTRFSASMERFSRRFARTYLRR